MTDEELSAEQVNAITAYVDVEAPPPGPSATGRGGSRPRQRPPSVTRSACGRQPP